MTHTHEQSTAAEPDDLADAVDEDDFYKRNKAQYDDALRKFTALEQAVAKYIDANRACAATKREVAVALEAYNEGFSESIVDELDREGLDAHVEYLQRLWDDDVLSSPRKRLEKWYGILVELYEALYGPTGLTAAFDGKGEREGGEGRE